MPCMSSGMTITKPIKNLPVWSVMWSVSIIRMVILLSTTPSCVWRNHLACVICWLMARGTLVRSMAIVLRRCVIPKCVWPSSLTSSLPTLKKIPSIGSITTTVLSAFQTFCRHVFPIYWWMVLRVLRWVWRPIWRRTTSLKWSMLALLMSMMPIFRSKAWCSIFQDLISQQAVRFTVVQGLLMPTVQAKGVCISVVNITLKPMIKMIVKLSSLQKFHIKSIKPKSSSVLLS